MKPWTDEHKRWALWVHLRIAADLALRPLSDGADPISRAAGLASEPRLDVRSERGWRRILVGYGKLTEAEALAAVRLVRDLASGRRVRVESATWSARPDVPTGLAGSADPEPVRAWVRDRNEDALASGTTWRRVVRTRLVRVEYR